MRQPIDPAEMDCLRALFGPVPCRPARLELSAASKDHWWRVLEQDRRAEVVLIAPRPSRRVLLISKPDYPADTFRLPTGGVGLAETVLAAASRELFEETGLSLQPRRLLGIVDWTFTHCGLQRRFASYLCLFPMSAAPVQPADPHENIGEYRELDLHRLDRVISHLRRLPPEWKSWGEQRAIPHDLVSELLGE